MTHEKETVPPAPLGQVERKVGRPVPQCANDGMQNQNNCASCDHKGRPDGGWCYIFRAEPGKVCMQHTSRIKQRSPWMLKFL